MTGAATRARYAGKQARARSQVEGGGCPRGRSRSAPERVRGWCSCHQPPTGSLPERLPDCVPLLTTRPLARHNPLHATIGASLRRSRRRSAHAGEGQRKACRNDCCVCVARAQGGSRARRRARAALGQRIGAAPLSTAAAPIHGRASTHACLPLPPPFLRARLDMLEVQFKGDASTGGVDLFEVRLTGAPCATQGGRAQIASHVAGRTQSHVLVRPWRPAPTLALPCTRAATCGPSQPLRPATSARPHPL